MRSSALAITISKSKYMAGVQCLKRLYLLVQSPELGTGKSASDFARMEQAAKSASLPASYFRVGSRSEQVIHKRRSASRKS